MPIPDTDASAIASEVDYQPRSRIPTHTHPWGYVSTVIRGSVQESCLGADTTRRAGDVRLMPAGIPHANAYDARGARCLVVRCDLQHALPDGLSAVSDAPSTFARGSVVSAIAMRIHREVHFADALSPVAIHGLLRELVVWSVRARADRAAARVQPWVLLLRDLLRDSSPRIPDLGELSKVAGVHPSQVVRGFKQHFGQTPTAFAIGLRIERASRLLTETSLPISDIALQAGFSDQAHLTRRFRAARGVTPGQLRRMTRD